MISAYRMRLEFLLFTGQTAKPASISFGSGLNVVWGSSNTGKSFAVEAIDFMLGGKSLRQIDELAQFDSIHLGISFSDGTTATLRRSKAGGDFRIAEGLFPAGVPADSSRILSARHDSEDDENISAYLLKKTGLRGRQVVKNASGTKVSLSFRHLSQFLIVGETEILSNRSPVFSGLKVNETLEKGVFRVLISGMDDSAVIGTKSTETRKLETAGRIEALNSLLDEIKVELLVDHPDSEGYEGQLTLLENAFNQHVAAITNADESLRLAMNERLELSRALVAKKNELRDKRFQARRFADLAAVYESDLIRLSALEEASFLLTLDGDKPCPLCGAESDHHAHLNVVQSASRTREAANAEIQKIELLKRGLIETIAHLDADQANVDSEIGELQVKVHEAEARIHFLQQALTQLRSDANTHQRSRDKIREGLELRRRRLSLEERLSIARQPSSKAEPIKLPVPSKLRDSFSQTVEDVLKSWQYPGATRVSFNESKWDIEINGTERGNNGKGVLAITHSAFKLAVLLFAIKHHLPHPGFLVLDTPLLTYRDPIKEPRYGALTDAELQLAESSLKDHFFEHLALLGSSVQTIVFENIEPTSDLQYEAEVLRFTKSNHGRYGLLPPMDRRESPAQQLAEV